MLFSIPVAVLLLYGAFYDAKTHIIPDWIPIATLGLAITKGIHNPAGSIQQIAGFMASAIVFVFLYTILKGNGLGGGDVKLIVALGATTGIVPLLLLLFVASLTGSVYLLFTKKKSLAFAPCLAAGYLITMWS